MIKAPRPRRGKVAPVVYDTIRSIGGGTKDTIWENLVDHGDEFSRKQMDAAIMNGVSRGYYLWNRSDGEYMYFIASAQHYNAVRARRVAKASRKRAAKKRAAKKQPTIKPLKPVQIKPEVIRETVKTTGWPELILAFAGGFAWGAIVGFIACNAVLT